MLVLRLWSAGCCVLIVCSMILALQLSVCWLLCIFALFDLFCVMLLSGLRDVLLIDLICLRCWLSLWIYCFKACFDFWLRWTASIVACALFDWLFRWFAGWLICEHWCVWWFGFLGLLEGLLYCGLLVELRGWCWLFWFEFWT